MPVIDPAAIVGIISDLAVNIISYAGIAALLYAIGGILIRTISWTFDKLLINFIGMFYKYFEIIINGTLLTDAEVTEMMNRVYLLVGVFVLFRLGMLLINYVINPSEVMDEKVGVNALIKRVIIGMILIIFMPKIFEYAFQLQEAILGDQIIEKVIMSDDNLSKVEAFKEKHGMGKIIGMTVFRGFFSLSGAASKNGNVSNNFDKATNIEKDYDLSVIDKIGFGLKSGILHETKGEYSHDYFPIFSTVILGFVLWMLIQYCLDAVVRSFKLSVLQVIAPICIVEYMINSDRNEVFKSWRKSVIATFAMLFMRVASIWFVAYVTMLMQPGMADSSSLLQANDNLLKAIIVLGLLAFMMDFPKMMSDVFGLDLDQSGSVKNVMGKAMGAATAGLAIGGAVAGFGMKAAGGTANALKGGLHNMKSGAGLKNNLSNFAQGAKTAAAKNNLGSTLKGGLMGVGAAVMGSNAVTGSVHKGYAGAVNSAKGEKDKAEHKAEKDASQQQAAQQRREDILYRTAQSQVQNNPNATKQEIIDSMLNTEINAKLNGADISNLTTVIEGRIKTIQDGGQSVTAQDVTQHVQQVLSSKLNVTPEQTTQIVNQVMGNSEKVTPDQIDQVVNQVVQTSKDGMTQEITQVVNQVMGTTVSTTVDSASQTVDQKEGKRIDGNVTSGTQQITREYQDNGGTNVASTTQEVIREYDNNVDTNVTGAKQTVTREIDTLFDEGSKIATRDSSGEYHVNFDDNTLSD